jgi:hypothetical protein
MRVAGRLSWRFEYGNGQASDLRDALFARDVAGLEVPPSHDDIPPPLVAEWLVGQPPPGLAALTAADLAAAADQWLRWWRLLLTNRVSVDESRPPPGAAVETVMAWAKLLYESAVFDPPDFDSLASAPELQSVVRATHGARPRGLADRSGSFNYQLIRLIAEQTAAEFGVSMDAIDATAHVLDVQGSWWRVIGPGCVLCSPAATTDPEIAEPLLRELFASRLGRA